MLRILRDIYKQFLAILLWDPWNEWAERGRCTPENKFASGFS
jgi:hypothetical protein